MKPSEALLKRLLKASREPRAPFDEKAPFGFATRVAARWKERSLANSSLPIWEQLCGRAAVGFALAACLVSVTVWLSWVPIEPHEEESLIAQINEIAFKP